MLWAYQHVYRHAGIFKFVLMHYELDPNQVCHCLQKIRDPTTASLTPSITTVSKWNASMFTIRNSTTKTDASQWTPWRTRTLHCNIMMIDRVDSEERRSTTNFIIRSRLKPINTRLHHSESTQPDCQIISYDMLRSSLIPPIDSSSCSRILWRSISLSVPNGMSMGIIPPIINTSKKKLMAHGCHTDCATLAWLATSNLLQVGL